MKHAHKGYTCLGYPLGGEVRGEHANTYNTAFIRWVLMRILTELLFLNQNTTVLFVTGTPTEARHSLASRTYLEYLL